MVCPVGLPNLQRASFKVFHFTSEPWRVLPDTCLLECIGLRRLLICKGLKEEMLLNIKDQWRPSLIGQPNYMIQHIHQLQPQYKTTLCKALVALLSVHSLFNDPCNNYTILNACKLIFKTNQVHKILTIRSESFCTLLICTLDD